MVIQEFATRAEASGSYPHDTPWFGHLSSIRKISWLDDSRVPEERRGSHGTIHLITCRNASRTLTSHCHISRVAEERSSSHGTVCFGHLVHQRG